MFHIYNDMFYKPLRHEKIKKEPKRDFHFTITGHSLHTIKIVTVCMLFLFAVQEYFWGTGYHPSTILQYIWHWMSVLWITGLVPTIIGMLGMISFKHPHDLDRETHIDIPVSWRIVSRGTNIDALHKTVQRIRDEMRQTPLFPYIIEVVVDNPIVIIDPDVRVIVVPKDYQTPNGTRFKARALHYAAYHSEIPDHAWIIHLDEETQPTSSGIKGITKAIREENDSDKPRIGQGALLYHRNWEKNHFLFLADMIRTGDDFGRFYFQHTLGQTIFGLHGSFIVVRNDVEKNSGGFDFGPDGDITEDATWALYMMEKGYRSRWVEGYLEEQPTQSVIDLLKQRKRWWSGLWDTCRKTKVSWRWKGVLAFNIFAWALAPFASIYTFAHLFFGTEVHPVITFLANFIYASYFSMYMIGLYANMKEGMKDISILNKAYLVIYQIIITLLPILNTLEGLSILWAIVKRDRGFHVVKK